MTTRVAVIGAKGRMGTAACDAIRAEADLELVNEIGSGDRLEDLLAASPDVAIELSTPSSVEINTRFCLENGIHTVVGASGLSSEEITSLGGVAAKKGVGLLVVPNFALGAVLMMRFAATAARYFEWAEIVERHHEKKLDSPSGTALRTAGLMELRAGGQRDDDEAARGLDVGGVRIHSLRMPGSVAHQEVLLGAPGETLSIKHDSIDRISFMPGLILAAKKVGGLNGVVVGLENILDI